MATLPALLGRLEPDGWVRGCQFERICAWWLIHSPRYHSHVRRVWLWAEWPGRRGAEAGIDLVGKGLDGRRWAMQAKLDDPAWGLGRVARSSSCRAIADTGTVAYWE